MGQGSTAAGRMVMVMEAAAELVHIIPSLSLKNNRKNAG
jgi:hypothetical protein